MKTFTVRPATPPPGRPAQYWYVFASAPRADDGPTPAPEIAAICSSPLWATNIRLALEAQERRRVERHRQASALARRRACQKAA